MSTKAFKQKNHQLGKLSEGKNELTPEQFALIQKAREEIKNGVYYTYDEVKEHFAKLLEQ
jgi:hypothetical protein